MPRLTTPGQSSRRTRRVMISGAVVGVAATAAVSFVSARQGHPVATAEGTDLFAATVNTEVVDFYLASCQATVPGLDATPGVLAAAEEAMGHPDPAAASASLSASVAHSSQSLHTAATEFAAVTAPHVRQAGGAADEDWSDARDRFADGLHQGAEEFDSSVDSISQLDGFAQAFPAARDEATQLGQGVSQRFAALLGDARIPNQVTAERIAQSGPCSRLMADPTVSGGDETVDQDAVAVWSAQVTGSQDLRDVLDRFTDLNDSLAGVDGPDTAAVVAGHIAELFTTVETTATAGSKAVSQVGNSAETLAPAVDHLRSTWAQITTRAHDQAGVYQHLATSGNLGEFAAQAEQLGIQISDLNVAVARAQLGFTRLFPATNSVTAENINQLVGGNSTGVVGGEATS